MNLFTSEIEFSAYPRGGKPKPKGGKCPVPPERNPESPNTNIFPCCPLFPKSSNTFSTHYLSTNHLLSGRQFGFRSGFSTQEALLSVTNDWHQLLASNHQVGAVFFDIRKALILYLTTKLFFHWFLLVMVQRLPIRLQYQRVVLEGVSSPLSQITSGVPQGSILGSLLFIIFIDSILKSPLSRNAKLALCADDIVLYKPINSEQDVQIKLFFYQSLAHPNLFLSI